MQGRAWDKTPSENDLVEHFTGTSECYLTDITYSIQGRSPNPKVQTLFKQLTFFHAHITQSEDEDGLSLAYELIDAGM